MTLMVIGISIWITTLLNFDGIAFTVGSIIGSLFFFPGLTRWNRGRAGRQVALEKEVERLKEEEKAKEQVIADYGIEKQKRREKALERIAAEKEAKRLKTVEKAMELVASKKGET